VTSKPKPEPQQEPKREPERETIEKIQAIKNDPMKNKWHQQEGVAFADTPLIKIEPTERIGETIEKKQAIKNDPTKNKQMLYRGYQNYEVCMRTVWREARHSIYTDAEGQIIAPLNSFVSIKREDSTMWSRAFEIEIKATYNMGHIRDKQDIQRIMTTEFSKAWEEQLVSYGVIYDSEGRFVEPTCCIILTEYKRCNGQS
jgi:hypothetical protein